MICGNDGEHKQFFLNSPVPKYIEACLALEEGIVVSNEDGLMLMRNDDADDRQPFRIIYQNIEISKPSIDLKEKRERVIAFATTTTQDCLYAVTNNG